MRPFLGYAFVCFTAFLLAISCGGGGGGNPLGEDPPTGDPPGNGDSLTISPADPTPQSVVTFDASGATGFRTLFLSIVRIDPSIPGSGPAPIWSSSYPGFFTLGRLPVGHYQARLSGSTETFKGNFTESGERDFYVTDCGPSVTVNYPRPIEVHGGDYATVTMPALTSGEAYDFQIPSDGGTPPLKFEVGVASGNLDALRGLAFDSDGHVHGLVPLTPQSGASRDWTLDYTVTDSCTIPRVYKFHAFLHVTSVFCAPPPVLPPSAALTPGTVGVAYYVDLTKISGGHGLITYALVAGTPPPGTFLSGAAMIGTPTTPGDYNFTILATDACQQTSQVNYSIHVS